MRTCKKCLKLLDDSSFYLIKKPSGKAYLRRICKICHPRRSDPEAYMRYIDYFKKRNTELAELRSSGKQRERFILQDSRKADKLRGLSCDLDIEFIQQTIAHPCAYCGASPDEVVMTLDRIDNGRGHTKDNVVQACDNCNITRGDMPHIAWLVVASGMRAARQQGLFDGWNRRKSKKMVSLEGIAPSPPDP